MIAKTRSKVLMVGLPQSGKTTFLAALWHIVQETGVPSSLRLKELRGDRTYLNRIREAWFACRPLDRTTIQNEQLVTLCLESSAARELELTIPDLSGESFELRLRERRWPTDFDGLVNDARGILLFIHPDLIRPARRVDLAQGLAAQLRRGDPSPDNAATCQVATTVPPAPWSHELMPTQVQLVELLQFMLERRGSAEALRVVVIISAWDLLEALVGTPKEVLWKHLPLLWQFLDANPETITHTVVGVSAQGGDLDKDRVALLGQDPPSLRVRVVGLECDPHDLSAPVFWLLE